MTCTGIAARDVGRWLVCFVGIFVIACAQEPNPPSQSSTPPEGFPTDSASYTTRLAQFPLTGTRHERDRKSKSCVVGLCQKVTVSIQARGNTLAIDPDSSPGPATPVAVAHLVNEDKHNRIEKRYELLPGDTVEYDLWVNTKPGSGGVEWRIVGRTRSGRFLYGAPTDLHYCHIRAAGQPAVTDADFEEYKWPCNVPVGPATAPAPSGMLSVKLFNAFFARVAAIVVEFARIDGGWIECSRGCCT